MGHWSRKNVKILFAVESSSRAWGCASPECDYDIRFIDKYEPEFYLILWKKSDVIEFMTEEDLDGSGWDIAKVLKLLAKSNAPLIEWLFSSVVYYQDNAFLTQMRTLAKDCFSHCNLTSFFRHNQKFYGCLRAGRSKTKKLFLCFAKLRLCLISLKQLPSSKEFR